MEFGTTHYAILTIALVALILVGGYLTYNPGIDRDASAEWSDGRVDFSVECSGSDVYSAVLIGGGEPLGKLYIYVDERAGDLHSEASGMVADGMGPLAFDWGYAAEQITQMLRFRGFTSVETVDRAGLEEAIAETADDPGNTGILSVSFALPSSVYSGNADDPLLSWVRDGGRLYWLGSEAGRFHSDGDAIYLVEGNRELLFGSDDAIDASSKDISSYITGDVIENGFTDALSLKGSTTLFGLSKGLQLGYVREGYSTIAAAPFGSGCITVFAGGPDLEQFDDIGQTIAAGIGCDSSVLDCAEGKVTRGTAHGSMDFDGECHLYVYMGGTYTDWGRTFYAP